MSHLLERDRGSMCSYSLRRCALATTLLVYTVLLFELSCSDVTSSPHQDQLTFCVPSEELVEGNSPGVAEGLEGDAVGDVSSSAAATAFP